MSNRFILHDAAEFHNHTDAPDRKVRGQEDTDLAREDRGGDACEHAVCGVGKPLGKDDQSCGVYSSDTLRTGAETSPPPLGWRGVLWASPSDEGRVGARMRVF